MLTTGSWGQFPGWRHSRKSFLSAPFCGVQIYYYNAAFSFVHGLEILVAHAALSVPVFGWGERGPCPGRRHRGSPKSRSPTSHTLIRSIVAWRQRSRDNWNWYRCNDVLHDACNMKWTWVEAGGCVVLSFTNVRIGCRLAAFSCHVALVQLSFILRSWCVYLFL
jgi:hypothetical protein